MTQNKKQNVFAKVTGFTLIELLVVLAIIGILAGIVYANFAGARAGARDEARKVALKELQLAIELYKAQNDSYPPKGSTCGSGAWSSESCYPYIDGLTPDFIAELSRDPSGSSYQYRTNGNSYKVLTQRVESRTVTATDEFARCPTFTGCGGSNHDSTYAVYGGSSSAQW